MQDGSSAVARTSISILVLQLGRYFLQFAYLIVMSRFLGPEAFGLVAIVLAIVAIAGIFSDFGLSLASIRDRDLSQKKKTTLFYLNSVMGVALMIIVALVARPVSEIMNEPQLFPATVALSVVFLFLGLGVQHRVEYSLQRRLSSFAKIEFVSYLASITLGIVFAWSGLGLWALVWQQVAFPFFRTALLVSQARWSPSSVREYSFQEIRGMLKFGNSATLATLLNFITTNLDTFLVGRFHGGRVVGLYNRAFQLASLPILQLTLPLTRLFVPMLSESSKDHSFGAKAERVQKYLGYMLLFPLSGIVALYHSWSPIIFGNVWTESTQYIWVLGLAAGFQSLGYIYTWIFLALGKPELLLRAETPGRLLMVIFMGIGVAFGPIFVAWAVVVGQITMWLATAFWQGPKVGFKATQLLKPLRVPLFVSLAALLTCLTMDTVMNQFSPTQLARAFCILATWLGAIFLLWKNIASDVRVMIMTIRRKSTS